jgi:hypothetical protein
MRGRGVVTGDTGPTSLGPSPVSPVLDPAEQAALADMRSDKAHVGQMKDDAGRFTTWTCRYCGGPLVPLDPTHGSCPTCSEMDAREICASADDIA